MATDIQDGFENFRLKASAHDNRPPLRRSADAAHARVVRAYLCCIERLNRIVAEAKAAINEVNLRTRDEDAWWARDHFERLLIIRREQRRTLQAQLDELSTPTFLSRILGFGYPENSGGSSGDLTNHGFVRRAVALGGDRTISNASLSQLAVGRNISGGHDVCLVHVEDVVSDKIPGIRHAFNMLLLDRVTRGFHDIVPYVTLEARIYIAERVLRQWPWAFFAGSDVGEFMADSRTPMRSVIVRPTAAVHMAEFRKTFAAVAGVEPEQLPLAPEGLLDLETLILTYAVSVEPEGYASDGAEAIHAFVPRRARANSVRAEAEREHANGMTAFLLMGGDADTLAGFLHYGNLIAALRAVENRMYEHAGTFTVPGIMSWLERHKGLPSSRLEAPQGKAVFQSYAVFGSHARAGSEDCSPRVKNLEKAIIVSMRLLNDADKSPDVRWVAASVIAGAQRFSPGLVERLLGDAARHPDILDIAEEIDAAPCFFPGQICARLPMGVMRSQNSRCEGLGFTLTCG